MSETNSLKSELTASEQAALWIREAACPIAAGMQIQSQISKAAMNLRITRGEAKRIWYSEASLKADYFLLLKQKYKKFINRKTTAAYGHVSGEFALLKSTTEQLECAADEKPNLSNDIKNLHEAIESLGESINRLSEQDRG